MSATSEGNFGPMTIKATGIALIVLTSLVVVVRFAGSVRRFKDLKAEDYLLIVGYLFFLELSILYIYITPAIFRLAALAAGEIPLYPTVMQDSVQLQIVFFVTTSSLWICLWMIKFSLLSMYKRLLVGKQYLVAWWAIMVSCILVWWPGPLCVLQTNQHSFSSLSAVLYPPGSPAPVSMPGLQRAHVIQRAIIAPPGSVYITHMRWIF